MADDEFFNGCDAAAVEFVGADDVDDADANDVTVAAMLLPLLPTWGFV